MSGIFTPTVGLEIHAELKTRTKMFCDSKNDPDEKEPNKNICPVCTGQPGTLPTLNREAVWHILRVGLSLGGELADFTEFDRKSYFYPDIPKGYQISQYQYPLVKGGELNGIKISRIHLEEDTATSIHDRGDYSLIDFNRAGRPLMELVTEPVIHSAKETAAFARELQLLLRSLEASEANLEKGEMRIEANVSVSRGPEFGTKVEVKNLNSFRSAEKAVEYEIGRQTDILANGGQVAHETRGWDESKEETFSQRTKEHSHDYRYFPEPDLPKLFIKEIPEFSRLVLEKTLPESPAQKRSRYLQWDLSREQSEFLVSNFLFSKIFEETVRLAAGKKQIKIIANYLTSDLAGLSRGENLGQLTADNLAKLSALIVTNQISSRAAKDILKIMYETGGQPATIAGQKGLLQKNNQAELQAAVRKVLAANPKVVEDYKNGKDSALQFLIGQGMKETGQSGNPTLLKEIFIKELT